MIKAGRGGWLRQVVGRFAAFDLPHLIVVSMLPTVIYGGVAETGPATSRPTVQAPQPAVRAHVDPRVELMSIIFRLAGNPEYNMKLSQQRAENVVSYLVDKFGIDRSRWTLRLLAEAVPSLRGFSHAGVLYALRRCGISYKRGQAWMLSPDPEYEKKDK